MKAEKQLTPNEISSFCSQTAMLIHAGITPLEAMSILKNDSEGTDGGKIYNAIFEECRKGVAFSEALKVTGIFPDYCLRLIALGEESGNLDNCLQSLTDYYEKEEAIKSGIKNAISYPLLMIIMMFVVIYVLMSRVLPIFEQVFLELGSDMSGIASSLMRMGESLSRYSWIILLVLAVLLILCLAFTRIPYLRKYTNRFKNWFPPTRSFYEKYACQRFASGMAMTLSSGIDTFTSLDMVSELTGDPRMQEKIEKCKEGIRKGETLAETLVSSGIFSSLYSRMVSIGFRSGNIDVVMKQIADSYEKETDRRIQNILAILEPTLVIILSILVGLILLSVILPLMGIMSSIG